MADIPGPSLRVVVFSGGRGSGALVRELVAARADLAIAVNGYDDGASTGEVRRFLGDCLGPSDFRKNAARLAAELRTCPSSLLEAVEQRLPAGMTRDQAAATAGTALASHDDALACLERFLLDVDAQQRPFDFSDCAIGNLVFAGAFLQERRHFNAAVDRFSAILGLPPGLIENVTDGTNACLVALTRDGTILGRESDIVDRTRETQIDEIFLVDRQPSAGESRAFFEEHRVTPQLNPRLEDRIAAADLIVYAAGTQHSSLLPSYMTPGLGTAIARNVRAVKLLLTNLETDAEIAGASAVDIIRRALYHLREKDTISLPNPCLITHYLVNDPHSGEPARKLVQPGPLDLLEDPRLVRIANFEEGATGRHDPAKTLTPFMRSAPVGAPRRIAVVLNDARSPNTITQSLLELVRGGLCDQGARVTVFHEGRALERSFLELLPFDVQACADDAALRAAVQAGRFDFVVLFDSSGAYHGEEVAALAAVMAPGRLDAAWGSRRLSPRDIADSYRVRYGAGIAGAISAAGSHLLSLVCLLLYGRYISDTLSGVLAVRTADYLDAGGGPPRQGLNGRLLARLLARRADILEVPVRFLSQGAETHSGARLADGARMLLTLFRHRPAAGATFALVLSVAVSLLLLGGGSAFVYAGLLLLAMIPGLPLGFALFGRRHAASWISGLLFGYAITVMAFWLVDYVHQPTLPVFILAWATAALVTYTLARRVRAPAARLPVWASADTRALVLVLLLVPALVTPPFIHVGAIDRDGNQAYRAYFTADFVWHTALTAELKKHRSPPRDPYLASSPLHYYWAYFIVPATIADESAVEVQDALKVNALAAGLLFISAIFIAAWAWIPRRPLTVAAAVALTLVAANAEGLAAIAGLLRLGLPLEDLKNLNVEAVTAWVFHGLRIDSLRRAMWYTPQHSMAAAMGLMALVVATAAGVRATRAATVLAGVALGASVLFNPFVGVVLAALYASTILLDASRRRMFDRLPAHVPTAVIVIAALGWCVANGVLGGVSGALRVGWFEPARNAPALTIAVSLGPILVPIAIALIKGRQYVVAHLWPAAAGIFLSLGLMLFVSLSVDAHWVGFRSGHLLQLLAPALVAAGLIEIERLWRRLAAVIAGIIILAVGLPTTLIDTYNAQDIENEAMGPGFRWTVRVTPEMREALDWIRINTPVDAVVQAEPTIRGRETWSLIPSFAERRMAAGLPISLMQVSDYAARSEMVRAIYDSEDAQAAWETARSLGIQYLYADETERAAYPGVAKFDTHPELFRQVFRNSGAAVYAVRE